MAPDIPQVIDAWKVSAVHASAYYSTMRSLIGQQAYVGARKTLDQWELELPLDKLAGDFPLAEAEYYLALKQFKRVQKILATYRQSVDLSNTLPQAMKMELYCLTQLDRDKEARDLAGVIIKRLPNHPLAERSKACWPRPRPRASWRWILMPGHRIGRHPKKWMPPDWPAFSARKRYPASEKAGTTNKTLNMEINL